MATVGEQLAISYARARAVNPNLRKGQFMQKVFEGRYKNEQSAYQAYNQTVKERRTGKKLGKLAEEAQPPIQHPERIKGKRRPRPGGTRYGLWKVNVKFTYVGDDGKEYQETRSFVAESAEYTSLMDIPYIEEIIQESVDEYIESWLEGDSMRGNYTDVEIEVVPIYRFDTKNVVDLDEGSDVIIADEWPEGPLE